jgi:hypothetical protein
MTACAHLLAALIGLALGFILLAYLAERRRSHIAQILIFSSLGATAMLFASFGFRISAFLYVFTGGSARFWFTLENIRSFLAATVVYPVLKAPLPIHGAIVLSCVFALIVYCVSRPSRYFGNTVPLLIALLLMPIYTTQTVTSPLLWALPFLFTFIGGIFADVLDATRKKPQQRRLMLAATSGLVVAQAALCVGWLAVFTG